MLCHHCHKEVKIKGKVFRGDECAHCGADVHCCLNCLNYDPTAHNRCREPQAEWISDREKANFCDFFIPNKNTAAVSQDKADPRKSFDDLFKK